MWEVSIITTIQWDIWHSNYQQQKTDCWNFSYIRLNFRIYSYQDFSVWSYLYFNYIQCARVCVYRHSFPINPCNQPKEELILLCLWSRPVWWWTSKTEPKFMVGNYSRNADWNINLQEFHCVRMLQIITWIKYTVSTTLFKFGNIKHLNVSVKTFKQNCVLLSLCFMYTTRVQF